MPCPCGLGEAQEVLPVPARHVRAEHLVLAAENDLALIRTLPEPGTVALDLTCAECGRSPEAGETFRLYLADIGEAVTYCPGCAELEFAPDAPRAEDRRAGSP
jgi:hypothetical protein